MFHSGFGKHMAYMYSADLQTNRCRFPSKTHNFSGTFRFQSNKTDCPKALRPSVPLGDGIHVEDGIQQRRLPWRLVLQAGNLVSQRCSSGDDHEDLFLISQQRGWCCGPFCFPSVTSPHSHNVSSSFVLLPPRRAHFSLPLCSQSGCIADALFTTKDSSCVIFVFLDIICCSL